MLRPKETNLIWMVIKWKLQSPNILVIIFLAEALWRPKKNSSGQQSPTTPGCNGFLPQMMNTAPVIERGN